MTEIVLEGPMLRLRRGQHGFAHVWSQQWIQLRKGRLLIHATADAAACDDIPGESWALHTGSTRLNMCTEVMAAKFGRPCMFEVCNVSNGRSRTVTFSPANGIELARWVERIRAACIHDIGTGSASIFKACQLGDFDLIKTLVTARVPGSVTR